jgi:predicted TPR repeat methyltransferase
MQLGEIDAAIQNYQKALQQDENFFSAHNNLAVAFLNKQHIPLAIKHFELALQMHPENEALIYTVKMLKQNSPTESAPAEYIKSLFDAYADHYDTHLLTALDYQAPPLLLKAVQSVHVNIQPHSLTILDLGCGTGLCGEVFKPFARKLVGIDLSQKMLAEAKLKNIYDELIENNFLSYLQNSQEHYDLIVAADVLVYTGNLTLICNHVHQALANNGIFAFNTEISSNENFHMNQSGRFLHHASYLKLLAEECGFKIVYFEEAVTRLQNNEPVKGYIVCFKRP